MLKDILKTISTRYLVAILNLALIFVNAKVLGIEGLGLIGLIWASISIIVMVNGILGGSSIVYFINKFPIRTIFPIAYLWTFVGTGIACFIMHLLGLLPEGYTTDIYLLTVLYSLAVANSRFLLGKDHITGFNLTNMLQGGLLFFILLCFYFIFQQKEVASYIKGLYLANAIAFIVSILLLLPYLLKKEESTANEKKSLYIIVKEMFTYGLWGSADNIAETCTARLNYFFVERFVGLGGVGLLDIGTKVSESVWNISRSIAYIEYNRIAKTQDPQEQKEITIRLLKFTFLAIALVMGCILLIPEWVYTDILFSQEFTGVRKVILALSAGIVLLGCNMILSHYFIGSGKIKYSTASSCIGLATLLSVGYWLIPAQGVVGSAISTSIAFCAMFIFSSVVFTKLNRCTLRDLLFTKDDLNYLKGLLKKK
ncbi:O-antigen/teichoic acid export membrane protein [Parabacteroides sp. PF5-5]|uniref:lipopolysaccharide biosynthesis protein n=1 Tax=unclassified Parabacteroides TaxID=2649774 RepID=UPI00247566AF|nr:MULTISPECIES: polysaccharide biosynthesis C-terminal domain-containing protein [unclassified Parabacteroides]MDH6303456.1 O-antigen/teichoic acid export membrane protein [Parabacteroides sp. PH5-39]MDH6314778.1 O-antigen/teichoic acid export membrane protein [Parabacteroides sp. PF5-13]MDH6318115.1 O-antigen/teichoic acid export membrane protein [Parabacteroides sp. PH5-13]MDH6321953.1 O-antigen/teichoic acid export membrane protein [Parabacteroides sp. PH5-8]MDH6326077.1 O-antigen/teichoic